MFHCFFLKILKFLISTYSKTKEKPSFSQFLFKFFKFLRYFFHEDDISFVNKQFHLEIYQFPSTCIFEQEVFFKT